VVGLQWKWILRLDRDTAWGGGGVPIPEKSRYVLEIMCVVRLLECVCSCMAVLTVFVVAGLVCGSSGCGGLPVCECVRV
jgi:hypothetical protein